MIQYYMKRLIVGYKGFLMCVYFDLLRGRRKKKAQKD